MTRTIKSISSVGTSADIERATDFSFSGRERFVRFADLNTAGPEELKKNAKDKKVF